MGESVVSLQRVGAHASQSCEGQWSANLVVYLFRVYTGLLQAISGNVCATLLHLKPRAFARVVRAAQRGSSHLSPGQPWQAWAYRAALGPTASINHVCVQCAKHVAGVSQPVV